jgi:hypothetical protein
MGIARSEVDRSLVVPTGAFHPIVRAGVLDQPPRLVEDDENVLKVLAGMPAPVTHPTSGRSLIVARVLTVVGAAAPEHRSRDRPAGQCPPSPDVRQRHLVAAGCLGWPMVPTAGICRDELHIGSTGAHAPVGRVSEVLRGPQLFPWLGITERCRVPVPGSYGTTSRLSPTAAIAAPDPRTPRPRTTGG